MSPPAALPPETVERFARNLDRLVPKGERIGLAVSGGADSLAMLLLAAAARPGEVEAATVDHGLRPEAEGEALHVAQICEQLGVPHTILKAEWEEPPSSAIQEKARAERYRLLRQWAAGQSLAALAAAHHQSDQAETLMMRLVRGAGVRGLAGMRAVRPLGAKGLRLVRPLLGWSREELERICADAGVEPVADPSNDDDSFERVRVRKALASADWLDSKALARSAANLAAADSALEWATDAEWKRAVRKTGASLTYSPSAPFEIRRRIASRAVSLLATEGTGQPLRGAEIDRLVAVLAAGRKATLRGVLANGGEQWRFSRAPKRRAT